jgi:invasion protein IalB
MHAQVAGFFLFVALAVSPAGVLGQGNTAPAPAGAIPTQSYKDWSLDCLVPTTGAGAGKRVCFIHHEARSKTDATLIAARIVIRGAATGHKLILIVQLPPNTVQGSGFTFAIDAGKPEAVPIQACLPKFCYGAAEFTPVLQAAAKVGVQLILGFTAKSGGTQQVPVSLAGITAALAGLEKAGP